MMASDIVDILLDAGWTFVSKDFRKNFDVYDPFMCCMYPPKNYRFPNYLIFHYFDAYEEYLKDKKFIQKSLFDF